MAVWNFLVRLFNLGHTMEFYAPNTERRLEPTSRHYGILNLLQEQTPSQTQVWICLIDILHQSAYMKGAAGVEVEVNDDRTTL